MEIATDSDFDVAGEYGSDNNSVLVHAALLLLALPYHLIA